MLKLEVNVFSEVNFTVDTTTPAAAVIETTQTPNNAHVIDWQPGNVFETVHITQDEWVRFFWSSGADFVVTQVTEESYDNCIHTQGIVKQWTVTPSASGDVFVSGSDLPVGESYFISGLNTHCALGLRIKVNVIPGLIRLYVKVWSSGPTVGDEEVNASFIGVDMQVYSQESSLNLIDTVRGLVLLDCNA